MRCRVCGRDFDPRGFQVVVPGLGMGFDHVDCALEATTTGISLVESPPPLPVAARPAPLALPAVAAAGGPAFATTAAASVRPSLLVGANLALLAAGTAATIYLWLRLFSPDAATLPVEDGATAFGRSSISAEIDAAAEPGARPQPEAAAFGGRGAPGASAAEGEAVAVANRTRATTRTGSAPNQPSKGGGSGGPVARPGPPPAPPPQPPPEQPPRQTPAPAPPVPKSPPDDRVPGPTLPGPGLPDGSSPGAPGGGMRQGS